MTPNRALLLAIALPAVAFLAGVSYAAWQEHQRDVFGRRTRRK